MIPLKYPQVAAIISALIADGIMAPGEPVPSAAALSRATGYSTVTCRRALRALVIDGVLAPGASPGSRPRVPPRNPMPGDQNLADAARALSAALAAHRRAAGLTQPQLAKNIGMSVTSIGHAETGRLWQSRHFWELADKGVRAGGKLLALHDAYRTAGVSADPAITVEEPTPVGETATEHTAGDPAVIEIAASEHVTQVTVTWADGAVTTVYAPQSVSPTPDTVRDA